MTDDVLPSSRNGRSPPSRAGSFEALQVEYQHAVDCVVQCEGIIQSLQDKAVAKDMQISILERKLIAMSLELASAKALGDELQHKLQQSTTTSCSCSTSESSSEPQHQEDSDADAKEERKQLAQSLPLLETWTDTPGADTDPSCLGEVKADRPRVYQSLSSTELELCSHYSLKPSARSTIANSNWPMDKKQAIDANTNNRNKRRSTVEVDFPSPSSNAPQRRLSNIGQYINMLRPNKNDSVAEAPSLYPKESQRVEDVGLKIPLGMDISQYYQARRNSRKLNIYSSNSSVISGVIFPVSSDDCLSCLAEPTPPVSVSCSRQQGGTGNEEWPSFY